MGYIHGTQMKYLIQLLIISLSLYGSDVEKTYIVSNEQGFIDYSNRIVVSQGSASIIKRDASKSDLQIIEKNIELSKGEARAKARQNLLDLVMLVNFDGRTVGDIVINDPLIDSRINTLVGSAYQQGEIQYLEKNEVSISLAIKLSGLAEILVDATGHINENLSGSAFLMTKNSIPKSQRTSGVVIDARNIYHVPAMVPKVFNENDKLVYGPRHYTRSRSVNRGPVGYAHGMEDGNVRRRVGSNPILVEAVSSDDTVNLTISNLDAERIRDAEKKFGVLTNCKVLVLLK